MTVANEWPMSKATVLALGVAAGLAIISPGPAAAAGDGKSVTAGRLLCVHGVATGHLEVRAGPSAASSVVGQLGRNDCNLRVVGRCDNGWCEMARGNVRGWIDTRYVGVHETPAKKRVAMPRRGSRSAPGRMSHGPVRVARGAVGMTRLEETPMGPEPGFWMFGGLMRLALGISPGGIERSTACVARVAPWDTLRMRSGPGVSHSPVGEIPSHACRVVPAGQCHGPWCRVAWRGRVGWVNTFYLE